MGVRRRQFHSFNHLRRLVIPEPVLVWLKAGYDGVPSLNSMFGAVPAGRTVTATNVSALRAAAQMQPPTIRCEALHTTGSTWLRLWIDSRMMRLHLFPLLLRSYSCANLGLTRPTTFWLPDGTGFHVYGSV